MYRIVRLHRQFYIYLGVFAIFLVSLQIIIKIIDFKFYSTSPYCEYPYEPIDVVYTWVNGSDPKFLEELSYYLKLNPGNIDSSKQRFDDKNELKFSLRSLEKYAPWINHVYIVTNGQIPHWLDLDYDKVTLITHEQIFKNKMNLPTFSSPAIESNLHRIPKLSQKFIYFNDDIFLGQPVYLEDFYSLSKGFILYLAWPVPACAPNCPWIYVNDGQCDSSCNNYNCQNDGTDCIGLKQNVVVKDFFSNDTDLQIYRKIPQNIFSNFIKANTSISSEKLSYKEVEISDSYTKNFLSLLQSHKNTKSLSNYSKIIEQHNLKVLHSNRLKRSRQKRFIKLSDKRISNLDAFTESLQHTNRVFNKKYGFKSRRVPSHSPIFIDKTIMEDLQSTFPEDFQVTEMNRFRRANDMQFSFSYYYFVISEKLEKTVGDIFDEFDSDSSGTWSDRELRNLLATLYDLPLTYEMVDEFESVLINCSQNGDFSEVPTPPYERYIDSRLPTISKDLVQSCLYLSNLLQSKFGVKLKYKYAIKKSEDSNYVTFVMLKSNISDIVINLDKIRNRRSKFICLNDNLDGSNTSDDELARAILYDFYISLFPNPSKFELPETSRNRFSYVAELDEWRRHHFHINVLLCLAIAVLLCSTLVSMCKKKCCQCLNKCFC